MKIVVAILGLILCCLPGAGGAPPPAEQQTGPSKVYVLPIRQDIMPPLVYLVRRGVKEAMEARADVLILDMETNGGRVDTTEEIIQILNRFPGLTVTYVNRKAFSAGAFISVATQKIYMAPQSVIGAAAPLLMSPGGGVEVPETLEAKMTSGVRALVRANAEKNGHNVEVVEAMIDKRKELTINGDVLNEKGQILTLTDVQAAKVYGEGDDAKPLLSSGTVQSLDALLEKLGHAQAQRIDIKPTGAEQLASWINKISPLLLIIGIIGIYLEMKTPGFGLPGIAGLIAFAIYFLGGYIAGLSGAEWVALFVLGLALFILELFVFPGTFFLGLSGAVLMMISIIMAMVDIYPRIPGPGAPIRILVPIDDIVLNLSITAVGTALAILILSRFLPKTALYHTLVSQTASGEAAITVQERRQSQRLGESGVAVSVLRPGGKAQFGDQILDVVARGEMIPKGQRVKIVGYSGADPLVEEANNKS